MATSVSGLRTLRTIYRHREDARQATDVSYNVYAALLVLLVVGIPVTRTLVILLSPPEVLNFLQMPTAESVVGLAFGAILILLTAVGSVRGPVLLSPFFVTLLADTATPRSRTLSRSFTSTSFVVLTGLLYVGIVLSAVRVFGGGLSLLSGLEFVAACVLFAIFACVVWLLGQTLGHHAWTVVVSLGIVVLGSVLIGPFLAFTPWGWLGVIWSGDLERSVLALAALTLLAVASLAFLPAVLNPLSRDALLQQAHRWQAASVAAATGDLATALGRFRTVPRIGRRWRGVAQGAAWVRFPWTHSPWVRFLRSDTVGAIRTPIRFLGGLATLIAAFSLLTVSLMPSPVPAWLLGTVAAGGAYLGCGVLIDGFRHSAVSAGAPPLYPYSTTHQYAMHLTFPMVVTGAAAFAGFAISAGLGASTHTLVVSLLASLLVAVLVVLARASDSAKGPPPLILMTTPISSPAGDPMILFLFAWQADALLIAAATGGIIVSLLAAGNGVAAAVVSVVVATGLALLLQRRLGVS